jgi:cysteine desulfurase/selenocysteine lyase
MIYLDNAATSYPKPDSVYAEILRCMRDYCANPGRASHRMSISCSMAIAEAREVVAGFFNIPDPLHLSFTKNATEALNIAIKGCLKPKDHVITTSMEHNSVVRPLKTMERDWGVEVSFTKSGRYGETDPFEFVKLIKRNTRLVACTMSSNVNGIMFPVKEIGEIARDNGILFLVDASQGAGYKEIDVTDMNIDLLAFPGHKGLLGPQGTGGLYIREGVTISPLMQGGTGSESKNMYQPHFMPDLLESGTLNTPGIIGLACGIKHIESIGLSNIKFHKHLLAKMLIDGMSEMKNTILYSKPGLNTNSGIAAVNFRGFDSTEISSLLDKEYQIAVRGGIHCAPMAHETLGTGQTGLVRFSMGCFNTIEEIEYTLNALHKITRRVY